MQFFATKIDDGGVGCGMVLVWEGSSSCQSGVLLNQPLWFLDSYIPPEGFREVFQGEGRGASQNCRGQAFSCCQQITDR